MSIDLVSSMHNAMEEEFNRVAGTVGWRLIDLPRMSNPFFAELISKIGSQHLHIMAGSQGSFRLESRKPVPCEPWTRASLLISPEGMANLAQGTSAGTVETGTGSGLQPAGPVAESDAP